MLVVFFGSFYLVNLMLAVVAMSYEEEAASTGKVSHISAMVFADQLQFLQISWLSDRFLIFVAV